MPDVPHPPPGHPESDKVAAIAAQLSAAFGPAPRVAMVLGSGLGPVKDRVVAPQRVPFAALGLPTTSVTGHAGAAIVGQLNGVRVVVMAGRVHLYEGWHPADVVRGVRALAAWGVEVLVLTNAAGGVHADLPPGTLVRIVDHINFMGSNPLVGPAYGTRFVDGSHIWDAELGDALEATAKGRGVRLARGVYAGMLGPSYETPAEVRMLRTLGADVVGMSTVPEALAAAEVGMSVAGVAVVTNFGAGVTDAPIDHGAVTAVAGQAASNLADILEAWLPTA